MCPASKSLEADEILKYKNNQEKLITNQAKTEHYHCFALTETVKPSDLGDQGREAHTDREFNINTGKEFDTQLIQLAKGAHLRVQHLIINYHLTQMPDFPQSHFTLTSLGSYLSPQIHHIGVWERGIHATRIC